MKKLDHIPHLGGPVLLIYRAIWVIAMIAALADVALHVPAFFGYRAYNATVAATGVEYMAYVPEGMQVVPISDEAIRAGVVRGDLLLRIDGKPAPPVLRAIAPLVRGPDGSKITLTFRSPAGNTRDVSLTRNSAYLAQAFAGTGITYTSETWFQLLASIPTQLLMLAVAALLFARRARDPVVAMLSLGIVIYTIDPLAFTPLTPMAIRMAISGISVLLIAVGVLFFPDGRFQPRWWPAGAIACVVLAAPISAGPNLQPTVDFVQAISALVIVAIVVARFVRMPPGPARQQVKLAVLGIVALMAFMVSNTILYRAAFDAPSVGAFFWLHILGGAAWVCAWLSLSLGLYASLARHRLYDADAAISRSVAYGVLTLSLLAIFAGSERVIELLGEEYFGKTMGALAGGVGAAFAAVMMVPLHHRLNHWAEKRFQKQLIRLRHGLPPLLGDLRETAPLHRIAAAVLDSVERGVRASRAALLVGGELVAARAIHADEVAEWRRGWVPAEHDGLDCVRADPLFPMRVPLDADGHERTGWLLLGPRPDGSFYGKDEREALAEIADPVARALEIARLREERERAMEERMTAQQTEVSALRRIVEELLGQQQVRRVRNPRGRVAE